MFKVSDKGAEEIGCANNVTLPFELISPSSGAQAIPIVIQLHNEHHHALNTKFQPLSQIASSSCQSSNNDKVIEIKNVLTTLIKPQISHREGEIYNFLLLNRDVRY